MSDVVIVGDGETAVIAHEYFTHDSPHRVAAFAVERAHISRTSLQGLDVVPLETVDSTHPPAQFSAFVAISYSRLNRVRARLYKAVKAMGYRCESYVSSRATVWPTAGIGENCMVQEGNNLQHGVTVGDNCVLWAGNHIGHRSAVGAHTFISSHVVVSGWCRIGESCFLGVNSSLADGITIADDCVIGMGAVVNRDTEAGRVYAGNPARALEKDAYTTFEVPEGER